MTIFFLLFDMQWNSDAFQGHKTTTADTNQLLLNAYLKPIAHFYGGIAYLGQGQLSIFGEIGDGQRNGMRLFVFDGGGVGEQLVFTISVTAMNRLNGGNFFGQRAGFVEDDCIYF